MTRAASVAALIAIPLICTFFLVRSGHKERLARYWIVCAIMACCCMLLEGVVFNWGAIETAGLTPREVQFQLTEDDPHMADIDVAGLEATRTVRVTFDGNVGITRVRFYLEDDATKCEFLQADERLICPRDAKTDTVIANVESNGRIRGLRISWEHDDMSLRSVTVDEPIPYAFRFARLFLMLAPLLLAYSIHATGLWRIAFDPEDRRQVIAYAGVCFACCLLPVVIFLGLRTAYGRTFMFAQSLTYDQLEDPEWSMAHQTHPLMLWSLFHGGEIPQVPDEGLAVLSDPYDWGERKEAGVPYWWDWAYYDGAYYSYFGMTPVLLFYLPHYLIRGFVPSYFVSALFFSVLGIIAAFLCTWEAIRRFAPGTTWLAASLVAPSIAFGSEILTLQVCTDMYYLTVASSVAFIFLTLWTALRATRHARTKLAWFAACGVCTFLLVWSRPGSLVTVMGWLLPLFLFVLLDKEATRKRKLGAVLSYLIPAFVGAITIMAFNYTRFDNPFEFGHFYQLTVEDLNYNGFRLEGVIPALWYYLCQGLSTSAEFPWLRSTVSYVNHSGNFFYVDSVNTGALAMPITWGLLLWRRSSTRDGLVLLGALLTAFATIQINYVAAGVAQRYVCDVLPALCLVGAIHLLRRVGDGNAHGDATMTRVLALLAIGTFIVASCLVFSNERNYLASLSPNFYLYFVNLLSA